MKPIQELTAFRAERGMSVRALAIELGVSKTTISEIELGKRLASVALLLKLERLTGISPQVLRPDLAKVMSQ